MKLLPTLIAVAFTAVSYCAVAADAAKTPAPANTEAAAPKKLTPQQEKMKACNAEAREKALKGGDRKAFMRACLKKERSAPAAK